jgi:hypothetical protein
MLNYLPVHNCTVFLQNFSSCWPAKPNQLWISKHRINILCQECLRYRICEEKKLFCYSNTFSCLVYATSSEKLQPHYKWWFGKNIGGRDQFLIYKIYYHLLGEKAEETYNTIVVKDVNGDFSNDTRNTFWVIFHSLSSEHKMWIGQIIINEK